MSEKKFQFISPGVFVEEIDKSFLAEEATIRGPLVIGRSERGPTMAPVKVQSFAEFAETFGTPIPGGKAGDVWRDGNYTAPTYAAYAAQAYLRNNSPITFVRLVGSKNISANATEGTPGYELDTYLTGTGRDGGGAQALFIFNSGTMEDVQSGTLAAVWYFNTGSARVELAGRDYGSTLTTEVIKKAGVLLRDQGESTAGPEFKAQIANLETTASALTTFNFNPSSDKFIRKVFNTNPTLCNGVNTLATE